MRLLSSDDYLGFKISGYAARQIEILPLLNAFENDLKKSCLIFDYAIHIKMYRRL